VLPDYQAVIFDEAHQIEEVASQYFGPQSRAFRIEDLIGDITRSLITDVDASREMTRACAREYALCRSVLARSRAATAFERDRWKALSDSAAMFVRRLRDGTR
jgi:Rad3-related DNA helicase